MVFLRADNCSAQGCVLLMESELVFNDGVAARCSGQSPARVPQTLFHRHFWVFVSLGQKLLWAIFQIYLLPLVVIDNCPICIMSPLGVVNASNKCLNAIVFLSYKYQIKFYQTQPALVWALVGALRSRTN